MFAWSNNRVKPKMKATYTRKKLLNTSNPAHGVKSASQPTETITMLGEVDDGSEDDGRSIDIDSMDTSLAGDEPSLPIDNSSMLTSAANAQVLQETAKRDREPSAGEEMETDGMSETDEVSGEEEETEIAEVTGMGREAMTEDTEMVEGEIAEEAIAEDEEVAEDDESDGDELYDVECFMADDYRKLPGTTTAQPVLLTKWAGFDKVGDLTWEPESDMRDDVPQIVEAYYAQKNTEFSRIAPKSAAKHGRGHPKKLGHSPKDSNTPRGRGRPRKDSIAPVGSSNKVTKSSRGRGRPRKVVAPETEPKPKTGTGRRGRPPKVRPSEAEQQQPEQQPEQ